MNSQEVSRQLRRIEDLAKEIVGKGSNQTCGTEWQKWSYALIKARKIIENERSN